MLVVTFRNFANAPKTASIQAVLLVISGRTWPLHWGRDFCHQLRWHNWITTCAVQCWRACTFCTQHSQISHY